MYFEVIILFYYLVGVMQMKKIIRICMLHNSIVKARTNEKRIEIVLDTLGIEKDDERFEFMWEGTHPDYLIVTEDCYCGKYKFIMKKWYKKAISNDPLVLWYAGECIEPDLNVSDYAFVFDRIDNWKEVTQGYGRLCRVPHKIRYNKCYILHKSEMLDDKHAHIELKRKKHFCNFIYSNGQAHYMRDTLFHNISAYKKVDSLGRHLRNTKIEDNTIINIKDWRKQSIEIKKGYKFSIAAENATYSGYVSEKLLTSLEANTIPIYWGDPNVGIEFNEERFINAMNYRSMDELLERIREIDNDDDLYCAILAEKWKTEEQEKAERDEINYYYEFLNYIFGSDKKDIMRKAEGYWPNRIRKNCLG